MPRWSCHAKCTYLLSDATPPYFVAPCATHSPSCPAILCTHACALPLHAQQDTIQTFYDITKQEVLNLENQISKKDREMEQMEDNHRVEVRVYLQKVKHLEYGAFESTHCPSLHELRHKTHHLDPRLISCFYQSTRTILSRSRSRERTFWRTRRPLMSSARLCSRSRKKSTSGAHL